MAIKDTFLQEVKIGNRLELMVGTKEMEGVVIAMDADTVHIRRDNGKEPVLSLDSITYYELSEDNVQVSDGVTASKSKTSSTNPGKSGEQVNNQIVKGQQSGTDVFTLLEERGDTFFSEIIDPTIKDYKDIAMLDHSKNSGELLSIANSLDFAIKQNHEISPADYKIQENIKKLGRLINNDDKNKNAANMLGALYFQCKSDRLALETYKAGDDNESAYSIALSINSTDYMELFACRHLIFDKELNPNILRWLILRSIEKDDYSIISKIQADNVSNVKLPGYLSFIRGALLINGIEYNISFDVNQKESLVELYKVFVNSSIGTNNSMAGYIPEEKKSSSDDSKPFSECPTFVAAKKAREQEKNFPKAEKLYLEAIKKNERPGAAAADLVGLMMQRHNYSKAAEYLGQYGSKYMREEAYKNVRAQLVSIDQKLAHKISQSEKVDVEPDYFFLAQKAELEEKDLQKSITLYKQAIIRRQRLTGSVPNLVSIYTRLEMFDEALNLLDETGKNCLDKVKYLNIRLSVFGTAKDPKYKNEIIDTYNQVIALSNSKEKRADILFSEAYLINQIGEYETAIALYKKCIKLVDGNVYLVPEKTKKQRTQACLALCNAYVKIEDREGALEWAKETLKLQPDNEFAKSILSGQMDDELEDEGVGVSKISDYFIRKIESINLENELKKKGAIKDGLFIGEIEEGIRIIDAIRSQQIPTSVNDEIKSNNYFSIAKIMRQIMDRDVEEQLPRYINEQQYQINVAIGCFLFGNYRMNKTEITKSYDTARYCFFEAICIFQDSDVIHQCLAAATARYIQTFFLTELEIRRERKRRYFNFENYDKDSLKEYFSDINSSMGKELQVPVEEYVVGMIEMLTFNSQVRDLVIHNTFIHPVIGRILDVLGKISDQNISDSLSEEQFKEVWNAASKKYYAKRKNYLRQIEETIESVFIVGQLSENYSIFAGNDFRMFLGQTDKEYLDDLRLIFAELLRYNEESEFDYKADRLGRADELRRRLEEKIVDNPTYISFEKVLPMLTQLQAKIFKESASLYGDSEPQLSVVLSGDCSFEAEKMIVRVPIAYTNRANAQNADNVQMEITGEGIENTDNTTLSRDLWVGDGRAKEKMLTFRISNKVVEDRAFSMEISLSYQYKRNMTETEEGSSSFVLTVPLYNESTFEPIENKFKAISGGNVVEDKNMFYGRDKDIAEIIEQIEKTSPRSESGKCLALYGQTRTGKSSMLYHLKNQLRDQDKRTIIIDMGSLGKLDLRGNNITAFLYKMLRALKKELENYHKEICDDIESKGIAIDVKSILEYPDQSLTRFNETFDDVYEIIKEQNEVYHMVLMIDEFTYIYDWIRQGTMTDRIMKFWKAFMQSHNIFAVIIGQDHMMQFMKDQNYTNDFGIMERKKVTYLPKEYALRLMDEPILYENENGEKISRYKKGALDKLYELTSGSAFLIAILCAGLVEYLNETRSAFITRAHIDDYIKKMLPSFEEINFEPQYTDKSEIDNEALVERNKEMLKRIALLSNKKEYTPVNAVVQSEEDRSILKKLEERDVIIITNGDRCKIKVALYKEWLIERYGLGGM